MSFPDALLETLADGLQDCAFLGGAPSTFVVVDETDAGFKLTCLTNQVPPQLEELPIGEQLRILARVLTRNPSAARELVENMSKPSAVAVFGRISRVVTEDLDEIERLRKLTPVQAATYPGLENLWTCSAVSFYGDVAVLALEDDGVHVADEAAGSVFQNLHTLAVAFARQTSDPNREAYLQALSLTFTDSLDETLLRERIRRGQPH